MQKSLQSGLGLAVILTEVLRYRTADIEYFAAEDKTAYKTDHPHRERYG